MRFSTLDEKENLPNNRAMNSAGQLLKQIHVNHTNYQTGVNQLFQFFIQQSNNPAEVITQFIEVINDPEYPEINDPGIRIDNQGNTFWHYLAAHLDDQTTVNTLNHLSQQYTYSQRLVNIHGDTYLHVAAMRAPSSVKCFALYADYDALWVKNRFKQTALQLALWRFDGIEIVKQLLTRHAMFPYRRTNHQHIESERNYINLILSPISIPQDNNQLRQRYCAGLWDHIINLVNENQHIVGYREQIEDAWRFFIKPNTVEIMSAIPAYQENDDIHVNVISKEAYFLVCITQPEQLAQLRLPEFGQLGNTLLHYLTAQPFDYSFAIKKLLQRISRIHTDEAIEEENIETISILEAHQMHEFSIQKNSNNHHVVEYFLQTQTGSIENLKQLYIGSRIFSVQDRLFSDRQTIAHALAAFPQGYLGVEDFLRQLFEGSNISSKLSAKWRRKRHESEKTIFSAVKDLFIRDTGLTAIQTACNQDPPNLSLINLLLNYQSPANPTVMNERLLHYLVQWDNPDPQIDDLIERLLRLKQQRCFSRFRRPANAERSISNGANLLQSLFAVQQMEAMIRYRRAIILVHYGAIMRSPLNEQGDSLMHHLAKVVVEGQLDQNILNYFIGQDPRTLSARNKQDDDVFEYIKDLGDANGANYETVKSLLENINRTGYFPQSTWVIDSAGVALSFALFATLCTGITYYFEAHAKEFEGVNASFLFALASNFLVTESPLIYTYFKRDYARICKLIGYHTQWSKRLQLSAMRYSAFLVGTLFLNPILGLWYENKITDSTIKFLIRRLNSLSHFMIHALAFAAIFREFEDGWSDEWSYLAGLSISLGCSYITAESYFNSSGVQKKLNQYDFYIPTYAQLREGDLFHYPEVDITHIRDLNTFAQLHQLNRPNPSHPTHTVSPYIDRFAAALSGIAQLMFSLMISSLANQIYEEEHFLEETHFSWTDPNSLLVLTLYGATAVSSIHYSQGFMRSKIAETLTHLQHSPREIRRIKDHCKSFKLLSLLIGSGAMLYPAIQIGRGLSILQHHETTEFLEWLDILPEHSASTTAWWMTRVSLLAYSLSFLTESLEQGYTHANYYLSQPCKQAWGRIHRSTPRLYERVSTSARRIYAGLFFWRNNQSNQPTPSVFPSPDIQAGLLIEHEMV